MFVRAQEIAEESDDPAQTDLARLYIDANWANLELDWGDYAGAAERADRCVLLAQRLGLQDQYIEALLTRGLALLGLQELHAGLAELQRALNVAQLTRDHQRWSLALSCRALGRTACRQTADAVADGKEALAIALRCGASRAEMLAQRALAEAYLAGRQHARGALPHRAGGGHRPEPAAATGTGTVHGAEGPAGTGRGPARRGGGGGPRRPGSRGHAGGAADPARRPPDAGAGRPGGRRPGRGDPPGVAGGVAGAPRASAWRAAAAIIAQAQAEAGDAAAARASFALALQRLQDRRQRILHASGVEALLEDPEAPSLWRQWLRFLLAQGQAEEALRASPERGLAAVAAAGWKNRPGRCRNHSRTVQRWIGSC